MEALAMDSGSGSPPGRNGYHRTVADWLPEIVDRIVRAFRPLRIVQHDWGADQAGDGGGGGGDWTSKGSPAMFVGLLVVMPDSWRPAGAGNPAREILERLRDIPVSLSIDVSTPGKLARHGHIEGTTLHQALTRGRVLYQRE
jgi:hypothetical protein